MGLAQNLPQFVKFGRTGPAEKSKREATRKGISKL